MKPTLGAGRHVTNVRDTIIIGAGPAGITAAIYAARKRMHFSVITGDVGGQTNWTAAIENYTGYQFIRGGDLVERFREHLVQFKIDTREGEYVQAIEKNGDDFIVLTDRERYETKSIVIASGRTHRKLGVPGEDRLRGKGVAYCATCDAPVFTDQDVAVVGGGNSALDAALQLCSIARKVTVIDVAPHFRADPVVVEKVVGNEKTTVYHNAKVTEIFGDKFVDGIMVEHDGMAERLPVNGIFIEVGSVAASAFAHGVDKNERGELFVNCKSETNVPGIFAAGDVTHVPAKQIIVACGEGAKAALSAFEYVSHKK